MTSFQLPTADLALERTRYHGLGIDALVTVLERKHSQSLGMEWNGMAALVNICCRTLTSRRKRQRKQ